MRYFAMSWSILQQEERLGELAMEFRGTRVETERKRIAREYEKTVNNLIRSNVWDDVPPPEDQLPRAWMPEQFFEYWSRRYSIS
jgi:hypothetical protein